MSDSKLAYESLTETSVDKPELKQKFLTQDVVYLRRDGMMSATLRNCDWDNTDHITTDETDINALIPL